MHGLPSRQGRLSTTRRRWPRALAAQCAATTLRSAPADASGVRGDAANPHRCPGLALLTHLHATDLHARLSARALVIQAAPGNFPRRELVCADGVEIQPRVERGEELVALLSETLSAHPACVWLQLRFLAAC